MDAQFIKIQNKQIKDMKSEIARREDERDVAIREVLLSQNRVKHHDDKIFVLKKNIATIRKNLKNT